LVVGDYRMVREGLRRYLGSVEDIATFAPPEHASWGQIRTTPGCSQKSLGMRHAARPLC
jgi:hypothetical protein